jgi:hypothetical protein
VITKQSILFEAANVTLQVFNEIWVVIIILFFCIVLEFLVVTEWITKIVVLLILFQACGGNKRL